MVVIGGGNTAIDAAIQSKLLARGEVVMAYRRGPEQMSATGYEQQLAKSSGVVVRDWLAPKKIKGAAGKVTGVEFVRTKLDAKGKLVETKETVTIQCDMVLKAVGQTMIEETLAGLELKNGKIAVTKGYATSLKGIFAGGRLREERRGPDRASGAGWQDGRARDRRVFEGVDGSSPFEARCARTSG